MRHARAALSCRPGVHPAHFQDPVSNPAQRPPADTSPLELSLQAITELLLLALSMLAGFSVVALVVALGVLPVDAGWAQVAAGPLLLSTAGAAYLGIERLLARNDEPVRPLVWKRERKPVGTCVLIVLGGFAAASLGAMLLTAVQAGLFSVEAKEQAVIVEIVTEGGAFEVALLAVSAVILAPLTEELLFRHMFFRRLLHRAGPTLAWILPALAFSAMHGNLSGAVIYVWLGLVFAFAYLLSGRLWVAMAVHACHNALGLTMLLFFPDLAGL